MSKPNPGKVAPAAEAAKPKAGKNERVNARKLVDVSGHKGTKEKKIAVKTVDTKVTEKDGLPQSTDKVFIADCEYVTIEVPTCALAITMNKVKHAEVTVDRVMTVVELVDCEDVTLRMNKMIKNIDISKAKDILLDFSPCQEIEGIKDVNVVTESWSQVKIGYKIGDKFIEKSVPTKIDHKVSLIGEELHVETKPNALSMG